jgi:hypothetical protein
MLLLENLIFKEIDMKYRDLNKFIEDNGLLTKNVKSASGIYVITVDGYVAAIRNSPDVKQGCYQEIYEVENAVLTQRYDYILLYAAKLGGHRIDCAGLKYIPRNELVKTTMSLQREYEPFLDKMMFSENPYDFKIEDLIHSLKYKTVEEVMNND